MSFLHRYTRLFRYSAYCICLLLLLGSCRPPQTTVEGRHYSVGYNFHVHADSLLLQVDRPMHWCQGVAQSSDSLWVFADNHLVVAAIIVIPEDCVDSVWVKVARDQSTMGWTHESDLLAAACPDDPISMFIRLFPSYRLQLFLIAFVVAGFAISIYFLHRHRASLSHFRDITSAYSTLLISIVAIAATMYAYIQDSVPQQWVGFYFYPTLNPLAQPLELCLFLCCVWLMLLLLLAVVSNAFSQLSAFEAITYLLMLLVACMVIYQLVSLAGGLHVWLAAGLCVLIVVLLHYYYFCRLRTHYRCGRCGARLRTKGRCPHCGAIND